MVCEAKAMETAKRASKLIMDLQGMEETVYFTQQKRHKDMRLKRQPGTCHWCGDNRGAHPWKDCPANGHTCFMCGGNDHFARVCLEMSSRPSCPQTFDNLSRPDHSRKHVTKPKQQPVNVMECDNVDDEEDFRMYTLDSDPLSQPGKRSMMTGLPWYVFRSTLGLCAVPYP